MCKRGRPAKFPILSDAVPRIARLSYGVIPSNKRNAIRPSSCQEQSWIDLPVRAVEDHESADPSRVTSGAASTAIGRPDD